MGERDETENDGVGRRKLLKLLAGGAAGLGAAKLGSAFRIDSQYNFSFYGDGSATPSFTVDPSGNMSASGLDVGTITGSVTGDESVTDLAGNGLSVENGVLSGERMAADVHVYTEEGTIYARGHDGVISSGASIDTVLQNGIDSCPEGGVIYITGTYMPTSTFTIGGDKTLKGPATFNWSTTGTNLFEVEGPDAGSPTTTSLSADVNPGDHQISVSSTSGISEGDLVLVYDESNWSSGSDGVTYPGEMHRVERVGSGVIEIYHPLYRGYTTGNNAAVDVYAPDGANFEGFTVQGDNETGDLTVFHFSFGARDSYIRDVTVDKCGKYAVWVEYAYNVLIENCNVQGSRMDGYGYGVAGEFATTNLTVNNCTIEDCRHAISSAGGFKGQPLNFRIQNCVLSGGQSNSGDVVDSHQSVHSQHIINNEITQTEEFRYLIRHGATFLEVRGNTMRGAGDSNVETTALAPRGYTENRTLIMTDNDIRDCLGLRLGAETGNTVYSYDSVIISNNRFSGDNGQFFNNEHGSTSSTVTVDHLLIDGNVIEKAGKYYGMKIINVTEGAVTNNVIRDAAGSAVYLIDSSNVTVANNMIARPNTDGGSGANKEAGIALDGSTTCLVNSNRILDGNANMAYGIAEYNSADNNLVHGNLITGAQTSSVNTIGAGTTASDNN